MEEVKKGFVTLHGRGHKLSAPFSKQALELAELLELNEISAADLLRKGYEYQWRYVELDGPEIALQLFFQERKDLLLSLLSLLKVRCFFFLKKTMDCK